jgi:hypothetical protein
VSAQGFKTYSKLTDICAAAELTVQLDPMRPEPQADPELIANAERFYKAVRAGNAAVLRELMADTSELTLYSEAGPPPGHWGKCYLRRVRVSDDGANASGVRNATVEFALVCHDGCYSSWNVHMTQRENGWRGRSVTTAVTDDDDEQ